MTKTSAKNNGSSKPSAASSPAASSPSSPRMKANPYNRKHGSVIKSIKNSNGIVTKGVGIPDVAVVFHKKANNTHPAYLGNIPSYFEADEGKMNSCNVVIFCQQRDADADEPLQVMNKSGNSYPVDIAVIATGGQCEVSKAASKYAATLTEIARTDCRLDWKYGTPMFMYKGDTTGNTVYPLGSYLLSYDCVTVMKCIFEDITTKDLSLQKEDKDAILLSVFGDVDTGNSVIGGIPDDVFESL